MLGFVGHALLRPVGSPSLNVTPCLLYHPMQDISGSYGLGVFCSQGADSLINFRRCEKHDAVTVAKFLHAHAAYQRE